MPLPQVVTAKLDLKRSGPLPWADFCKILGLKPELVTAFEGATISLDTGKLQELIAVTRRADFLAGKEEEFLQQTEKMLQMMLGRFGLLLLTCVASTLVFHDQKSLTALFFSLEAAKEMILGAGPET